MLELDAGEHDAVFESLAGEPRAAAPMHYADVTPFDAQTWAARKGIKVVAQAPQARDQRSPQ